MPTTRLTYFGTITDTGLIFSNRKKFDSEIQQVRTSNWKEVFITIEKKKKKKSWLQVKYLFGLVYPMCVDAFNDLGFEDFGEDKKGAKILIDVETVHEFFKDRFSTEFVRISSPLTGEVIKMNKTTKTMSTTQYMGFIESIRKFASEFLGLNIPDPDPLWKLNKAEVI